MANAKSAGNQRLGRNVIIFGLAIQIYFFGFFMTVLHVFYRRICRNPTPKSVATVAPWRHFMIVLYTASILIMIRSVFRIVEYSTGENGKLQSSEVFIYVFDAALMLITTLLFNAFHPSRTVFTAGEKIQTSVSKDDSIGMPLRQTGH